MIGIYKITNNIDGKSYIGQSVNIHKRFNQHKNKCQNAYLGYAIKKYGIDNFSFDILIEIKPSPFQNKYLDKFEEMFIALYNTMDRKYGYNMMHGGRPGRLNDEALEKMRINSAGKLIGYKHTDKAKSNMSYAQSHRSEEWKKKNAEAQIGKKLTDDAKEKIRLARAKQKPIDSEARAKISKSMKGKPKSPEHIAKVVAAYKKWLESAAGQEYRKKLSERGKNRKFSEETRAKISKSSQNRKASIETKAKMSASKKGRIVSAETRAKISAARKGKPNGRKGYKTSPETKAKISIALAGNKNRLSKK